MSTKKKNIIKELLRDMLISFFTVAFILYLPCCFVCKTFNPFNWFIWVRAIYATFYVAGLIMLLVLEDEPLAQHRADLVNSMRSGN